MWSSSEVLRDNGTVGRSATLGRVGVAVAVVAAAAAAAAAAAVAVAVAVAAATDRVGDAGSRDRLWGGDTVVGMVGCKRRLRTPSAARVSWL